MANPPKKLNAADFGNGAPPTLPAPNPDAKEFRVVLSDGSVVSVYAFRMFGSSDANLGLVVRALREDDSETGVFYAPIGWTLVNPEYWVTEPTP